MGLSVNIITQHANYQAEKNSNFFTFLLFMSINFFAYAKAHERALKSLKDKNEQIESLLRILFHDVANPLAVITLSSDVMLKRKNFTEEGVQRISRAALNLKEQLESVKKLKTIKDGKYVLEVHEFYIKQMLDTAIDVFSEKCQSKKIIILTEYEDQTLKIKVDFIVFVNQIISNILSNSIKFSHPDSEILIKVKNKENSVQIIIQDFGIGMSEEVIKNLFDTEKVTSRAGTEKETGAGYGISLAKYFIESLSGTIEVQSTEQKENTTDHGTTFIMTFPRQD
jgi:signal transduction histidine kinase